MSTHTVTVRADCSSADELAKTKKKNVPGSRLRAAREHAGLSQQDLARLLDVRPATVSDRERAPFVKWGAWVLTARECGVDPETWPQPASQDH